MLTNKVYPWYIVGIGTLNLKDGIASNGFHQSTLHMHDASDSNFTHAKFTVAGGYHWVAAEQNWQAVLIFEQQAHSGGGTLQTLEGSFTIVPASPEGRYWMISTGAKVTRNGTSHYASEVVHGEIARTGDIT